MFSSNGDDFQEFPQDETGDQAEELEVELEAGPRAERPNFLTATRFVDFDLPPEILEGLDKAGFEYCTPIQAQAIPVAVKGEDIAGQAQTGTGKTTAFLVPLLNRLLTNKPLEPDVPRAIIVTPTRELALQIHEDAIVLASSSNLRQALVIGGMEYREQAELLAAGPEIVICTPGRIIDYLQQGVFKTKGIEVAVVDEADRLLDMGFIKDLKYLLGKLPPFTKRQTMLFSATLDERVLELTYQYMNPPQYITAEPDTTTKINIVQELYHVGREEKLTLLLGLLKRENHQRVIIFANTKSGVEWLSKKLVMNGFQAEGITGDLPQPKRLKLMESFKENRLQILVATDVASRGIHVDDVSHVYNYDLPQDAENYVHRIGRTARAGNTGKAVSFGCEDYVFHLEAIENLLGEKIPVFWAEADWFHEDQGGEVRLRERKSDRDRDRRKDPSGASKTGRGGDIDGDRRSSRGPAKSQRPGGIFGLSPRIAADGLEDARQTLIWADVEEVQPVAIEPLEEAMADSPAAELAEAAGERDNGRRRKRRRGRRGRGSESPTSPQSAAAAPEVDPSRPETAEAAAPAPAPGQETSAELSEAVPVSEKAKDDEARAKKSWKSSSKKPTYKKAKSEEAASETKPAAPEPSIEPSPLPGVETAVAEAADNKKPRYPSKRVTESVKAKVETSGAEPGPAAAEAAGEVESRKPKRAAKKAAPVIAVEEAKTEQSSGEKAEARKTRRPSSKTKAETAEPKAKKASPAAAKTPKTTAVKKLDETPRKSVKSKKAAEDKETAETPKKSGRGVKKAETAEKKPPKKTPKKTGAGSAAQKEKKSTKEDAESS